MFVKLAEILSKLPLCINVEVRLVAEEDHASSCNETRQVILLRIGKLGKVHSMDFGANFGVVIEDISCIGQEITELRITLTALVLIWNLRQWLPVDIGEDWAKSVVLIVGMVFHHCATRFIEQGVLPLDRSGRRYGRAIGLLGLSVCGVDS